MVKSIVVESLLKARRAVPKLEAKLKVKISMNKNNFTIKGNEYDEFICDKIFEALDFGFDLEDALLLTDENFVLEFVDIKEHTHRRNLKDVRARIIGRNGKALKTIENLTGSVLVVHDNVVGVIVEAENLDVTITSIESIIRGAKHGNAFAYLEKNKDPGVKYSLNEDLGLTDRARKIGQKENVKVADKILKEEGLED